VIANGDLVTAENKGKVFVYAPHLTAPVSAERSDVDEKFIFVNGYDIVSEYQREDWPRISTLFDYLTITIFDFENADLKASTISTLRAVASDFPAFALTYGDTKTWGSAASNMGATGTKYPTVISVSTPRATSATLKQIVWNEEVDFSEASLRSWFSSILDGSAVPFKKSEALPESNDGPVKILVHKNFDESVANHNIFVEFYVCLSSLFPSLSSLSSSLSPSPISKHDDFAVNRVMSMTTCTRPVLKLPLILPSSSNTRPLKEE